MDFLAEYRQILLMLERVIFVEVSSTTMTKLVPVTVMIINDFLTWFLNSEEHLTRIVCELCVSRMEEIEQLQAVGSFATAPSANQFRFTNKKIAVDINHDLNFTVVGIKTHNFNFNHVLTINSNSSINDNSSTSFQIQCYLFPLDLNAIYAPLPIDMGFRIESESESAFKSKQNGRSGDSNIDTNTNTDSGRIPSLVMDAL